MMPIANVQELPLYTRTGQGSATRRVVRGRTVLWVTVTNQRDPRTTPRIEYKNHTGETF